MYTSTDFLLATRNKQDRVGLNAKQAVRLLLLHNRLLKIITKSSYFSTGERNRSNADKALLGAMREYFPKFWGKSPYCLGSFPPRMPAKSEFTAFRSFPLMIFPADRERKIVSKTRPRIASKKEKTHRLTCSVRRDAELHDRKVKGRPTRGCRG